MNLGIPVDDRKELLLKCITLGKSVQFLFNNKFYGKISGLQGITLGFPTHLYVHPKMEYDALRNTHSSQMRKRYFSC